MKLTASSFGLLPQLFHPHSLRIGGASAMAAAGLPDYLIQKMGRWKSLAFLMYIRLSKNAFDRAVAVLTDPHGLCAADVAYLNTAVTLGDT